MTKKITKRPEEQLDYVLLKVELTLAVESFLSDQHSELRQSEAIETVLNRFRAIASNDMVLCDDIIVLNSNFETLRIVKADEV
jgi:hypothetical protein